MAKISEIKLPNNSIYQFKDSGALQLTGGTVTGPVNFGDSVYISDLNAGNLVVTGNAAFTNNIQANTINGVEVGLNPKFTDTVDLTQMTGILSVAKGGTGKTTGKDAANYFLNSLDIGASTPVDADYYISQYVSGGTTTTTYYRRPMSALWTYIKGKTDTLYVPYSLFDPRASYGTAIASNSNLDADCNAVGTYRSDQASTSQSLTGTVPVTSSGFKIFSIGGYGTKQRQQFLVHNSATDIMYRGSTNMGDGSTWSKWYKIVSLPSGSDNKTFSAVGSSTQPVYINANGQVIACTSYANASVAYAKYLITEGDNRSVATYPDDYTATGGLPNRIAFRGLKNNTYIGSPSSDVYSYLVGLRGQSDSSGGNSHEIAFNNSGIFVRQGATTVWGDWEKVLTDKNITEASILKWQTSTTAATNVYDFGVYVARGTEGATGPTNGNYYAMLNIPYRKAFGNTKADYSWSIAGSTNNDKRLFYRTSGSDTWGNWAEVAHINAGAAVGNATQPVYVSNTGVVTACTSYANASVNHATSADSATSATKAGALTNKVLNSTTIHNTAGSFTFQGSGEPWAGTDWVGLQVGSNVDKFQIRAINGATLGYRQNDSGGTNTSWGGWYSLLSSGNYTDYTVTKTGEGADGTWGIDITGNANTSKYLMNRGSNAVSINDSTWGVSIISQGHTIRDKVWHQQWKQSGLKFTPQGGSESNITDSADLVYYLSSSNTANSLTLNMAIDGIVYAGLGFKGVWDGNTIPITKGGTGQTTAKNAINALLNGLDTWTANPTDDTYFIRQDTNGAANYGKVKFSTIWNYIKTKTNASFNPGSLTITMDTTDKKKALISFTAPSFS